ncbi:DUF1178 family protein [Pulveribacter suum]|uniref:DUF1178 domain-containing protein n=1 Tax=Pulveribacter suum TaxID=2116657 RepID=A0A2P1NNG5_9BURK|nr:DUF1178 family protein [Pulveribacter suum]AVP58546.1 DUF1178 domain-containing protein [Pulveribacter suum]
MKVLDLLCAYGHSFEGWFGSEDDFQSQLARGLVQCPLCTSADIRKVLSAPRLNLRSASAERLPAAPDPVPQAVGSVPSAILPAELQAAWMQLSRKIVATTEDVGARFAQEARRMHHGEIEERGIRGQASAQEAAQLLDEGIAVLPLALTAAAKESLQ